MRILKSNPIAKILNDFLVDSSQPSNLSYMWNFGSLLGTCLILQILTGVFLAMHYQPHVDFAFDSVEHELIKTNLFSVNELKYNLINLGIVTKQTKALNKSLSDSEFLEWLRGFTDGEGSFNISLSFKDGKWKTPSFKYTLYLHKDDEPLLNYIQKRLNLGKVYVYEHFTAFIIWDWKELFQVIRIFDDYSLNTSKYLNFIAFKEAFEVYIQYRNNPSAYSPEEKELLFNKLASLKNSMNKNRSNFELPENHKIIITPYWLLGFIEGEGSFNVTKTGSFSLQFSIGQTIRENLVLKQFNNFY